MLRFTFARWAVLLCALQALDIGETALGRLRGAQERNPLAADILFPHSFALAVAYKAAVTLILVAGALWMCRHAPQDPITRALLWTLPLLVAGVVLWNLALLVIS